jgi:hypothetical protein
MPGPEAAEREMRPEVAADADRFGFDAITVREHVPVRLANATLDVLSGRSDCGPPEV